MGKGNTRPFYIRRGGSGYRPGMVEGTVRLQEPVGDVLKMLELFGDVFGEVYVVVGRRMGGSRLCGVEVGVTTHVTRSVVVCRHGGLKSGASFGWVPKIEE